MGLFYAYLQDDYGYQHVLIFISREAADEWWRAISTSPTSPYAGTIKRNSAQYYTQKNAGNNRITGFFGKFPDAMQFSGKVYIMVLDNYNGPTIPLIIPPSTAPDHISGGWYFIQSKVDPWSHWYVRIRGACLVCGDTNCDAVHVSSEYRTKFCIRVRSEATENPQETGDLIMIGRDEISIAAHKGFILHVDDAEDLKATKEYQGEIDLIFKDLKNRFITQADKQVNGEVWEYVVPVERGSGETWELVD